MTNNFAKCGCDCINCPTYADNLRTTDDRLRCSTGWKSYLNIKLSPEKLRACDGCSIPDSQRHIYYLNCKVRKCAMDNGFDNCAYCKGFPCDEIQELHSLQKIKDRYDFIKKSGKDISDQEYKVFIEPYAGLSHLRKIRRRLAEKDLRDYKKYSMRSSFASFNIDHSENKQLVMLYNLLTSLGIEENVSYARLLTLTTKRKKLMKILWIMGCYGTYHQDTSQLELDSQTFLSQKILSTYKELQKLLDYLEHYDILTQVIPRADKEWLTPSGGLRKEGWVIRLSFGNTLLGSKTLHVFTDYISFLKSKYGLNAIRYFNRVDLQVWMT